MCDTYCADPEYILHEGDGCVTFTNDTWQINQSQMTKLGQGITEFHIKAHAVFLFGSIVVFE